MRWIFRLVGALVLVVLVLVAGVFMLPAERVAGIAADQLRRVTGRDVTISGDVGLTFWPVLGVRAEGLEVGNASWAKEPAMLSTASAAIGIDAAALLSGEIRITNIEAQSPAIRLESRADGRASWEFTDASGAAQIETQTAPTRPAQAITIQKLTITDATLIYDAEGADTLRYEGVDLALDWPEPTAPAQIAATVRPAGTPVRVTATISDFAAFLAGAPRPLVAQLSGDGGTAALEGRASLDGAVEGALSLDLSSTAGFLSALGLAAPDLPQGLGQRVNATGQIVLTPDRRLALRGLNADLGGNRLRGDLDAELNGTPRVTANLNAGTLDLRALTGGGGQGGGGGTGPAGWPRSPIDASGLAAFNGVIALSADSVDLGALKLGRTVTRLTHDRARMVFALSDVAAYGGRLAGEFVMNNRNGLSVGGKLEARGVDMNP
ncbi:MAG: AsmA family protein, partial [Pseudomonadota bacterium]